MKLSEQILAANDLPTKPVEVPEWGLTVYVRAMNGSERDAYEADLIDNKDKPNKEKLRNMRAKMVVLCVVDEDGERVFEEDQVDEVGRKSANALNRIVDEVQKMNALSDDDIGEIEGN